MGDGTSQTRELGKLAARGVSTTAIAQLVAISTQLLGAVVLARLLGPEDYGLLAMVMAIVIVGEVIREFGLANAAIQAPILTGQQSSNLFWWNAGLGLFLAIALFSSAPFLASFYSEPRVEPVAQALAVTFILGGLATQPRAHLARDMRFAALNFTDVAPAVVSLVAAIITALLGWGVWALVSQRIIMAGSILALALWFDRWLPGLPRRTDGMRPLLYYGLHIVGAQLISTASRNSDYIVMGHRFGAGITGLYSRAFELTINSLNQINAPSTKVAVPVLSRLQAEGDRYHRYLFRGQRALLFVIVPVLGIGAALAAPLVDLVLGSRWSGVVPFVQALTVVAAADRILGYATWWYALSQGKTSVTLKVTIVRAVLVLVGVLVGSRYGPLGLVWGYALAAIIGWVADLVIYRWLAGAPSGKLFSNAIIVVVMNALPVGATLLAANWLARFGTVLHLILGLSVYFALWISIVLSIPVFRAELRDVMHLVRSLYRPVD